MSRFNKVYDRIKKSFIQTTDVECDFINHERLSDEYDVVTEDTLHIIDEYVKDPELTPVPKEFLNVICSKVKFRRDNVFKISMKELYGLLREYEYPFYQEFKQGLQSLNGFLYVVLLFDQDFDMVGDESILKFNSTYQFLLHYIKDDDACIKICKELLKEKHRYADAICSKTDADLKDDNFFKDNCLIYISLKSEFIKDSLEHELTHFVQKTVGFSKTEDYIENDHRYSTFSRKDATAFNELVKWLNDSITQDKNEVNRLLRFFGVKFSSKELHESIKAVLNGFQRIYEYGKFDYVSRLDFSKREIDKNESQHNVQFRLSWLETFISIINSNDFINDHLKRTILALSDAQDQQQYIITYRPYFIILLYFGFNVMFNELDIDEKLREHFKTFKYKDN